MPKPRKRMTTLADIMQRVVAKDGCWLWTGATTGSGYGLMAFDGARNMLVHRKVFELSGNIMIPGLVLDHTCRNRACCNPQHLEQVTHQVNLLRGEGVAAKNHRKERCKSGHDLTGANLYMTPDGRRQCRACRKEAGRRHYTGGAYA